jgi:hypothetical protein
MQLFHLRGDITSTAGIPVLEPRAADILILFVSVECEVCKVMFELVSKTESRRARSNTYHSHVAIGVHGLFA